MNKTDRIGPVFLAFITLIGLLVRLAEPLLSTFPLNDGGLFYAMILDLQANHFSLPLSTTYNTIGIPFAYPPLAFYLYALISTTAHISPLILIRLGPAIISAAAIPAFYLLAKDILENDLQIMLSTTIFAFIPRAFDWLIMGGGVTRALGMVFALLAMRQAYLLFTQPTPKSILLMILTGSLVVYTHPEATTHTILSAIFFFLWKNRTRKGFLAGLLVGAGILAATSPWWITILSRYGIAPYLAAADAARQDSYNQLVGLLILFRFNFTDEPFLTLLGVLGLFGMFYLLGRKKFFLPLWFVIMHTLEPRGGVLFMMIPLAMSAGICIDEVILPGLSKRKGTEVGELQAVRTDSNQALSQALQSAGARILLGFIFIYGIASAFWIGQLIYQKYTLTQTDLQAFTWIASHTASTDRFALITSELPLRDSTSEWFPVMTGRESIATVFGYEWIHDSQFANHIANYLALQACANQNLDCLESWSRNSGNSFNYVYLRSPNGGKITDLPLAAFLSSSSSYSLVYQTQSIEIFQRK